MALNIGTGPFDVYVDAVLVEGTESVDLTVSEDTTDLSTIQGEKVTISKSHSAELKMTFIDTGITNLKKVVPGAFLANATQIDGQNTGTVVNNVHGAIALGAVGATETLLVPVQIVPQSGGGDHTVTMFDCEATLSGLSYEDQVVKAEVTLRSRATGVQLLKGAITYVS
jgi:hypothetical protein